MVSSPRGGGSTNFELKTVDATANPYLALRAVIATGLDSVINNLDPIAPISQDPGHLPLDERISKGISLLPENLGQAICLQQRFAIAIFRFSRLENNFKTLILAFYRNYRLTNTQF